MSSYTWIIYNMFELSRILIKIKITFYYEFIRLNWVGVNTIKYCIWKSRTTATIWRNNLILVFNEKGYRHSKESTLSVELFQYAPSFCPAVQWQSKTTHLKHLDRKKLTIYQPSIWKMKENKNFIDRFLTLIYSAPVCYL